jgi:hypothetical protein
VIAEWSAGQWHVNLLTTCDEKESPVPIVSAGSIEVDEDIPLSAAELPTNTDPKALFFLHSASKGEVEIIDKNLGLFNYKPPWNTDVDDFFIFIASGR